jgi:hypothetical protein
MFRFLEYVIPDEHGGGVEHHHYDPGHIVLEVHALKVNDNQSRDNYAEEADLSGKPNGPHDDEELVLKEHAHVSFNDKE